MPLQPCNAKSDLSASRYSLWWAMRRGGLSTDKVRSKSCLQERSASPRNALDCVYTAELNLSRWVQGQHTRSELARDSGQTVTSILNVLPSSRASSLL